MGSNVISRVNAPMKSKFVVWIVIYFFIGLSDANATGENEFSLRSTVNAGRGSFEQVISSSPVRLAQLGDASIRLGQLEEQTRQLNGRVEELNFQLLQMQERLRKMQKDNEFRFQELEEKKQGKLKSSDAGPLKEENERFSSSKKRQDGRVGKVLLKNDRSVKMVEKLDEANVRGNHENKVSRNPNHENQIPSGIIIFDDRGNVKDTALGKPLDLTARLVRPDSNYGETGSIKTGLKFSFISSARELYDLGYDYFQVGDYSFSQQAFSEFLERFPEDKKIPDAKFWLGESLFSQSDLKEAAKTFLEVYTDWPGSDIAPQALLKLGISLAGMEQRELACSTYAKVFRKYPDASHLLRRRVEAERKSANCLNG